MDSMRKLIIGYDLREDTTQICCYSYKTQEPIAICMKEEEECKIPTVLCVKEDTKQWLYGEEAISCAAAGEGVLVENILTKLYNNEEVEIFGQIFGAVELMEKYFRKTLTLVKQYFPSEIITMMAVTIKSTTPELVKGIYEALDILGIERNRVTIISHASAYLYYALSQDKSLWKNDVGLFDFDKEGLVFYQLSVNRRTKPMIAGLTKKEYTEELDHSHINNKNNVAYMFGNIANKALYKQVVSTLYFTGCGFAEMWAEKVIQQLCVGRRVFRGDNLYTKGACFAAKEFAGDKNLEEFLLLNDDMITKSIAVRVFCDSKFIDQPIVEAGEIWYEVNNSIEVILQGDADLELVINNIMTKDIIRKSIPITNLIERPDRMTRLEIILTCRNSETAVVTVNDLGFGEIYPACNNIMKFAIEIK